MKVYICLLRGINVGGHKKIKMANLKASFKKLDFKDVVTYIQSGNIVFKSSKNSIKTLEKIIHQMLLDDYGFDIPVIVITPIVIKKALTNNPFEKDNSKDPKKFYVVFLQDKPQQENIEKLATYDCSPEEYVLDDTVIYFYAANGMHKAKMSTHFFENKLNVKATSRNWRTTTKLFEIVGLTL